ncbi:heavy metal-binding domain-containing protein [Paenibacillus sp. FSL H7-0331]|uniref:heavy metal-binding domain-containing protein n=1 Tax=Paenibacillus sp. FSL H7-0331 TaxID=1920421 RepID=UPI00096E6502|nr:YbjQ family protein [Paenibacillus sp. FSL H7-0331]OME98892.1 hypothetical protein BK127_39425 [Paenibacillus sp. FSL H7-0331]
MIVTTTALVEGSPVKQYVCIATGEVIMAANVGRDILASFTDLVGGRSKAYETKLREARDEALIPLRPLLEKLGVQVKWDQATHTINGTKEGLSLSVQIGSTRNFL